MNTTITADDLEIDVSEMSDDGVASVMAQKEKRIAELEAQLADTEHLRKITSESKEHFRNMWEKAEAQLAETVERCNQQNTRIAELEAIVTEAHRERDAAQARAGAYLYRAEQAEAACDAVIEDARALAQRINDMGDFWDWQTKESDIEIAKKYLTEETK